MNKLLIFLLLPLTLLFDRAHCDGSETVDVDESKIDVLWLTGSDKSSSRILDRLKDLRWKGRLFILRYTSKDREWRTNVENLIKGLPSWQEPILGHDKAFCSLDFSRDDSSKNAKKGNVSCQNIENLRKDCDLEIGRRSDSQITSSIRYCVSSLNDRYSVDFRPDRVLDDWANESSRLRADKLRQAFEVKVGSLKRGQEEFFVKKAAMIRSLGVRASTEVERYQAGSESSSVKIPPTLIVNHQFPSEGLQTFMEATKSGNSDDSMWFGKPSQGDGSQKTFIFDDLDEYVSMYKGIVKTNYDYYVLQPYLDLATVSIDFTVKDSQFAYFALHQNLNTCYQFFMLDAAIGGVRIRDLEKIAKAKSFARRVLDTVGFPDGLYHLEAFYDQKSPNDPFTFIEIARRYGGGFVPQLIERADGLDWEMRDMDWQLGLGNADVAAVFDSSSDVGVSAVISSDSCARKLAGEQGIAFVTTAATVGWEVVEPAPLPPSVMWVRSVEGSDEDTINATEAMLKDLENFCPIPIYQLF